MSPLVVPRNRLDNLMSDHNVSLLLESGNNIYPTEMFIALIYSILFISGVISNIWVLIVIITVTKNCGKGYTNVLFYTVSLTCVNLLVLVTVPATIADLTVGHWVLPDALCPFYWVTEMLNKVASSLIIAFIAIACYFGVCRPHVKSMYKYSTVAGMLMIVAMIDVGYKSYNVWRYSEVFYIVDVDENDTLEVYGKKCLFEPADIGDRGMFTVSAFVSGYVLPVSIMIASYAAILRRVYSQSRLISRRGMRQFQNVAKSASILVVFYLCTWTPYWCVTLLLSVLPEYGQAHDVVGRIAFFFHVLPMLNCAYSPLIYTFRNKLMREQYKKAREKTILMKETRTLATYV